MATGQLSSVVGYLRSIAEVAQSEQTDAEMLEKFARSRDEHAFASLVLRHGSMVLSVCHRVLGDCHDVEDAFQATFLVLAQKASSIRKRTALASWLYGVAYRIAQRARVEAIRRRQHEGQAKREQESAELSGSVEQQEMWTHLEKELYGLPERYRAPLVLCYLEGKTHLQAAGELGWTIGTVSGRLSRARDLLRQRLTRRGITLTSAACAVALTEARAVASVPMPLAEATLQTAALAAAGKSGTGLISSAILALAQGGIQTMLVTKVKMAVAIVATITVLGTGATIATQDAVPEKPGKKKLSKKQLRQKIAELEQKLLEAQRIQEQLREENRDLAATLQKERLRGDRARQQAEQALRRAEAALAAAHKGTKPGSKPSRPEPSVKLMGNELHRAESLRMLGLAFHNYHDTQARLPSDAIYSREGKPLLSWRVAVLPYLEQDALYKKFRLNEPWDSAHNKKLISQMPDIYSAVEKMPYGDSKTPFQVFTGKGAMFDDVRGKRFGQVPDGLTNTIMIAEAGEMVPWTKPEDLTADVSQPGGKLGVPLYRSFLVAMGDGSIRQVPKGFDRKTFTRMVLTNDGFNIDLKPFTFITFRKRSGGR